MMIALAYENRTSVAVVKEKRFTGISEETGHCGQHCPGRIRL